MKIVLQKLFLITLLATLTACTSAMVSIHSSPNGAEVYGRPIGGGDLRLLGTTPFLMRSSEFAEQFGSLDGAAYVELRKDGFKPAPFYVTEISKLDLTINKDMEPKRDLEMQLWLNDQVAGMFEVRRLVDAQRLEEALLRIREIKKETPMVSAIHEMEGGVLILKRAYRSALDAYRLAVKFNPENMEATKMIRYLEKTYNFPRQLDITDVNLPSERAPASEGLTPKTSSTVVDGNQADPDSTQEHDDAKYEDKEEASE
jgi:hypothetical protein